MVIIPHTITATNLKEKKPGNKVNVELDIIAKYVIKAVNINFKQLQSKYKDAELLRLLDNY